MRYVRKRSSPNWIYRSGEIPAHGNALAFPKSHTFEYSNSIDCTCNCNFGPRRKMKRVDNNIYYILMLVLELVAILLSTHKNCQCSLCCSRSIFRSECRLVIVAVTFTFNQATTPPPLPIELFLFSSFLRLITNRWRQTGKLFAINHVYQPHQIAHNKQTRAALKIFFCDFFFRSFGNFDQWWIVVFERKLHLEVMRAINAGGNSTCTQQQQQPIDIFAVHV